MYRKSGWAQRSGRGAWLGMLMLIAHSAVGHDEDGRTLEVAGATIYYEVTGAGSARPLVLADSAAPKIKDTVFLFDDVFPEVTERQNALAFADELGDDRAAAASIREYLGMLFYLTDRRDAFLAGMSPGAYSKPVNAAVSGDLERYDLNPEIRKFRFPALVVSGHYDMNVAPLVAWRIHQGIQGPQFRTFERSGHLPFVEQPEEFVQALEEFLAR